MPGTNGTKRCLRKDPRRVMALLGVFTKHSPGDSSCGVQRRSSSMEKGQAHFGWEHFLWLGCARAFAECLASWLRASWIALYSTKSETKFVVLPLGLNALFLYQFGHQPSNCLWSNRNTLTNRFWIHSAVPLSTAVTLEKTVFCCIRIKTVSARHCYSGGVGIIVVAYLSAKWRFSWFWMLAELWVTLRN